MLRARDSTDRPPPPPRRREPLLAPPRRPLKASHPEGTGCQRPLPQDEGSRQDDDGGSADGPAVTGEGSSPPRQCRDIAEVWHAEDDGDADDYSEPSQAVEEDGSTGWPAEDRLEPSPTAEGDENLLLEMQADKDVQDQEQGCNVEAVRVIPGHPLHNLEATWQAEITVPAEHGGVRCFGLHDGRQRTMCIRGPTRHQREHAEADCVELEAAAIDGGPKAVRACQGRLQRAKVLISNIPESREEDQQEEEYDDTQEQQIAETDPYLCADELGASCSRDIPQRSASQHRERPWVRHRRRSRSRSRMETRGRQLRPPPLPAGSGYSNYRANDRVSNSELSTRVSALLDFLGKTPMPRPDNGRADHDRRKPLPRDEERVHRKGCSVWTTPADSRSRSPRRRNSYRKGCSEDRDCAYDTAPWASGRASRLWSDAGRGQGFNGHPGDIEDFLAKSVVDSHAAAQLRACTPEKAAIVMRQGPIAHTRNPSSVLMARIRDADRQLPSIQQLRPPMQSVSPGEVERFIAANPTDTQAENRLRTSAPHIQRLVIDRGPLAGTRNPSSVLLARIRDAEHGRSNMQSGIGLPAPPPADGCCGKPEVERLIMRYNLDARAATTLRMLKPDQQRAAAMLPLHEARNPSAFIMAQVSIRFHGGPGGSDGGRPPASSRR